MGREREWGWKQRKWGEVSFPAPDQLREWIKVRNHNLLDKKGRGGEDGRFIISLSTDRAKKVFPKERKTLITPMTPFGG